MHITEISFKFLFTLHSAIFYAADFVAVKALPSFAVKTFEEINDKDAVNEIDKSIPHVTLILKINGQIKEIVLTFLLAVKRLQ
jgi:hypothetical protein